MVELAPGVDFIAIVALVVSFIAFAERWRGMQRARQEANILILSNQINDVYEACDENLARVLESRGKMKLKKGHEKERFLILQKLHVHLDAIQMMIKMEGGSFRNRILGKQRGDYYMELVKWYCSVHKFYNDLLDLFGIKDSSFLHDGLRDPHRTRGKPPIFLADNKYAKEYCEIKLKESRVC